MMIILHGGFLTKITPDGGTSIEEITTKPEITINSFAAPREATCYPSDSAIQLKNQLVIQSEYYKNTTIEKFATNITDAQNVIGYLYRSPEWAGHFFPHTASLTENWISVFL